MVIALILSGGRGSRIGTDIPKQYIKVSGRPVISWCMECLIRHPGIDAIQIVAEEIWRDTILSCMEWWHGSGEQAVGQGDICAHKTGCRQEYFPVASGKFKGFSNPGESRQLSIMQGLEDIRGYAADYDYVLIHDAARPMLSAEQITNCLDAVHGHDGVIPVLPMKDTVYYSEDGRSVASLLRRSRIYAGQAPELFVLGKYYQSNMALLPKQIAQINGSTEPAVMAGMDIVMIPGDEGNFKITTRTDLERFREIIGEERVDFNESMGIT